MAVATITLESLVDGEVVDSVVVSAPDDDFLEDDIILDTNPDGVYDTGFTLRTQSGAFETGGRVVGESVPIRQLTLPFWLTPETRPRFQRLWGTPRHLRKVRWVYDGPSGPRTLILKLAKEILYTTEDGFDADIDGVYHAVVTAVAVNPMYEGPEEVQEWANPDARFDVTIKADGGDLLLSFGGQTVASQFVVEVAAVGGTFPLTFGGQTTATPLAWNVSPAAMQSALAALSSVGAGNVTVTGTAATAFSAGKYRVVFANVPAGALTASAASLTGLGHRVDIDAGIPWNVSPAAMQASLEALSSVGVGNVTVTGTAATSSTAGTYRVVFANVDGTLTGNRGSLTADGFWGDIGLSHGEVSIAYAPATAWFEVWNPTDQDEWLEWTFDPADEWQWPDFGFGQERRWNQPVGSHADRMIVSPKLTKLLSVMSDPFMDTYVSSDLSNAAGLFNGVEPIYPVPPYTGTEEDPVLVPVICKGPKGAKVTLRQRRFWSAESGLEAS